MSLAILMPCHNEADSLAQALNRLLLQTTKLDRNDIVVICDRCTDQTEAIARTFGATVLVKNWTKYDADSIFTKPMRIAETLNFGLANLPNEVKYVLTFSPDGYMSSGYLEEALSILEHDSSIVMVGHAKSETPTYVRGMGMVIRRSYIRSKFGGYFPEAPAQDTYLLLKTLESNDRIARLRNNYLVHSRERWQPMDILIRAHDMARLGYTFVFAVGVSLRNKKPLAGIVLALAFIVFYFTRKKLSTQPFLSAWQKDRMRRWITRKGRREPF